MNFFAARQLVTRGIQSLKMELVGHGSSINRLMVGEREEWMVFRINLHQKLLPVIYQFSESKQ